MTDYKDYSFSDQSPSHTADYLYIPIKDILTDCRSSKILDIGCGNGSLAGRLLNENFDVYGIDASESGIQIAKNNFGEDRFWLSNLNDLELPLELRSIKFDAIISTEVIEHVYSPQKFIDYCKLALSPGGIVIISTPYHGYLKNLILALSGKMDNHFTVLWEGGHIKFFSRKTLTILLNRNNFIDIKFKGAGRVPFLWKSMILIAKKSE